MLSTEKIKEAEKEVELDSYYFTWHGLVDGTKDVFKKSYSAPQKNVKDIIELAMNREMSGKINNWPNVIRRGASVLRWLETDTVPDSSIKTNKSIEINIRERDQVNLLDEGTFKVEGFGKYNNGLINYPWVLLSSVKHEHDIIISLRALNHKLTRPKSPHKDLNFTLFDTMENNEAYWFTVGYLLNNKAKLCVRTTPTTNEEIVKKYKKITGVSISLDNYEDYVQYNPNEKTFADNADLFIKIKPEIRPGLYFPKNKVGKREGSIKNDIEHIQNTSYVWSLFNYGFRLGTKHRDEKVIEYVKENAREFFENFKEGYNICVN